MGEQKTYSCWSHKRNQVPNVDVGKYLEYKCISQENAFQGKELASNNSSRSNNIHISLLLARYHVNAHDYNYTNAQISQGHRGQSGWAVPPRRAVRDVWETQWWLAKMTEAWAIVWYSGLYLFSGLLNEVTQVVSLNTFPISIMNHLPLIIPVQPKGRGAFIQSNRQCVCACVRACTHCSVWVHANFLCSISAQSTEWRHG